MLRHETETGAGTGRASSRAELYHFHGCGAAFPWAMGYACFVRERCGPLDRVEFSGVSSGALAAVALALGLDLMRAVRLAVELQNQLCIRPSGLFGGWADLLVVYYERLLPAGPAVARLSNLHVGLTGLDGRLAYVSEFSGKRDLIEALLASQHLPFFVDLRPWAFYRGRRYLDTWWRRAAPPVGFRSCHEVALPTLGGLSRESIKPWERLTRKTIARAQHMHWLGYLAAGQALAPAPEMGLEAS